MPNHFSAIGFKIKSEEEFNTLIGGLLKGDLDQCVTPQGIYLRWRQDENFGPEVWFQVVNDNVVSVDPFFRGKSETVVGITDKVKVPGATPLDALLHAWAEPESAEKIDSGAYPFAFDMIALQAYENIAIPGLETLSLCAMAQEVDLYDSEEAYNAAQDPETPSLASESFIPTGLFSAEGGQTNQPRPEAVFAGKILETKKMKNAHTGSEFHWVLVKTLGATLDVVIDPVYVKQPIKVGGIIAGSFYLCGDFR
ncbi:MAG: hypothetical protein IPH06_06970 [Alphaproteobacteria bacterium]|nr:hypothetical protein [Alphaproteobacteria bacterium]QQS57757.1 MAG: hypothetical protein IPN28_02735 [Alphaproteobacteria bacterium]